MMRLVVMSNSFGSKFRTVGLFELASCPREHRLVEPHSARTPRTAIICEPSLGMNGADGCNLLPLDDVGLRSIPSSGCDEARTSHWHNGIRL
eukprot:scaffold154350_cov38-Prasinocladus_malaysianus.AAC.1